MNNLRSIFVVISILGTIAGYPASAQTTLSAVNLRTCIKLEKDPTLSKEARDYCKKIIGAYRIGLAEGRSSTASNSATVAYDGSQTGAVIGQIVAVPATAGHGNGSVVVVQPRSTEYVTIPPSYETVTETVVVRPDELVVVPNATTPE